MAKCHNNDFITEETIQIMILQRKLVIKSENDNDDNDNASFFFHCVLTAGETKCKSQ